MHQNLEVEAIFCSQRSEPLFFFYEDEPASDEETMVRIDLSSANYSGSTVAFLVATRYNVHPITQNMTAPKI